ncbi:Uu.00g112090.m01.CDS01 [Anthostomella pinea]|uniref:Uu.00g112090.m01.CDS01 n=1 Tax=Anthostomella pinea TaxID=933095 RepID=A0AAI8VFQ9_9PEZI|nr:Uu.00g112090.m01.CDS01 [Anthostomella pinea]
MPKAAQGRANNARSNPLGKSSPATSSATVGRSTNNYILQVQLKYISNPHVTRTLVVPADFTFHQLNNALIFIISGPPQMDLPPGASSGLLLPGPDLLRLGTDYSEWNDDDITKRMRDFALKDVFDNEKYAGKARIMWEYDFGDGWEHLIHFVGQEDPWLRASMGLDPRARVVCIAGKGSPVAEDCGGTEGWRELKNAFAKGGADTEVQKAWYKRMCQNRDPEGLNPYRWDIAEVNQALADGGDFPVNKNFPVDEDWVAELLLPSTV